MNYKDFDKLPKDIKQIVWDYLVSKQRGQNHD